jgi:hypothetical protein
MDWEKFDRVVGSFLGRTAAYLMVALAVVGAVAVVAIIVS